MSESVTPIARRVLNKALRGGRRQHSAEIAPLVRLDGEVVSYCVVGESGPVASMYHLRLAPQQTVTLQLDLTGVRVEPGRRELQVYVKGGPALTPACWPLDVTVAR